MKKNSSFFVKMEPPKKRRPVRERVQKPLPNYSEYYNSLSQSLNWKEILSEKTSVYTASREKQKSAEYVSANDNQSKDYSVRDSAAEENIETPENNLSVQTDEDEETTHNEVLSRKIKSSPELKRTFLMVRLAISSVLFAVSVFFGTKLSISAVLLGVAVIIAGYDVFFSAVNSAYFRNFSDSSFIITIVAITAFIIGFRTEAAALMILAPIGNLLIEFSKTKSFGSSTRIIDKREALVRTITSSVIGKEDSDYLYTESVLTRSIVPVLIITIVFSVLYAVLLPILTYYRPYVAIHRAITVILVCTPTSVITALPCLGRKSIFTSASYGVIFRNAYTLEKASDIKTFVLDKSGLFNSNKQEMLSFHSDRLDDQTFLNLLCHILHDSKQNFAKTILNYNQYVPYNQSFLSDYSESPGGVIATVDGNEIVFGTKAYVEEKGLSLPDTEIEEGIEYYLYISGVYGGYVIISSDISGDVSDLIHEMRLNGVNKCILISDQDTEEITGFAELNGFDVVYAGISKNEKNNLIVDICNADRTRKMILTSDQEISSVNQEDIVILAGESISNADAVVVPHLLSGICHIPEIGKRINQIAFENALLAFLVKGIVIFSALIGYCNIWMAITADIFAALITILNSDRVITKSIISTFIDK